MGSLPKRGEKDFQPEGTNSQSMVLIESRLAMYSALRNSRGHSGKSHITARWYPDLRQARVEPPAKGLHFQTMGKADRFGDIWLNQEELLYLVERGSLECYWIEQSAPMSLQALYSSIFCDHHDEAAENKAIETDNQRNSDKFNSIEHYQVYSSLKRSGYIVQRSSSYVHVLGSRKDISPTNERTYMKFLNIIQIDGLFKSTLSKIKLFFLPIFDIMKNYPKIMAIDEYFRTVALSFFSKLKKLLPTLKKNIIYSYNNLYQQLEFIPHLNILESDLEGTGKDSLYNISFYVWKPHPNFSKSNPPNPDFYVTVINSHEMNLPHLNQTLSLLNSIPTSKDAKTHESGKKIEDSPGKLYRNKLHKLMGCCHNIIIASVDSGIINMILISNPSFGDNAIYSSFK